MFYLVIELDDVEMRFEVRFFVLGVRFFYYIIVFFRDIWYFKILFNIVYRRL